MPCSHEGLRNISSTYDLCQKLLVFIWTCERCGKHMGEAARTNYQPQYQPSGNNGRLTSRQLNG